MAQEFIKTPERVPTPERPVEQGPRQEQAPGRRAEQAPAEERGMGPAEGFGIPSADGVAAPAPSPKPPEVQAIESILEADLSEVYLALPQDKQQAFKAKGEEVTGKILGVLGRARERAKDILSWIRGWLAMIPGVNKFFLEQESKIKTDRIVALGEQKKKGGV